MPEHLIHLVIGLIGIGFVIFLHELGHFLASRAMGIDVEVLSYGFGPRLFSIMGRNTEYRFSMIPFGGYCRMKGSLDLMKALRDEKGSFDTTEKGSYFGSTPLRRIIIYLSGPLMNILLAIIILSISAMIPVERISDPAYAVSIAEYPELFPDAPEQPGIEKGDRIVSSGSTVFPDWQSVEAFLREHRGEVVEVRVMRDGELVSTTLEPLRVAGEPSFGITVLIDPVIGRSISDEFLPGDRIVSADGVPVHSQLDLYSINKESFTIEIERDGEILERRIENRVLPFAWESGIRISRDNVRPLIYGVERSLNIAASAIKALGALVTFHLSDALSVLTGPVKAAENIGNITVLAFSESAESGIRSLLQLMAVVSISLAAGNLLPIPTFDGGQILICLSELLARRELRPRSYVMLQIIGMILALCIMVMMYSLDIKAYFFS